MGKLEGRKTSMSVYCTSQQKQVARTPRNKQLLNGWSPYSILLIPSLHTDKQDLLQYNPPFPPVAHETLRRSSLRSYSRLQISQRCQAACRIVTISIHQQSSSSPHPQPMLERCQGCNTRILMFNWQNI